MDGADQHFQGIFHASVVRSLVDAIKRAYDNVIERHDPESGSDGQGFGFNLYKFIVHEISRAIKEGIDRVSLISKTPRFIFKVCDLEVTIYRIGKSENADVNKSFPNNDSTAHTMNENSQLWFEGITPPELTLDRISKVILGHMGDELEGFGALYLCVVGATENKQIIKWHYTLPLWSRSGQLSTLPMTPPAPIEEAEAPIIRLRNPEEETTQAPIIRLHHAATVDHDTQK